MRENRLYGSEGGESQLNAISLPLSLLRRDAPCGALGRVIRPADPHYALAHGALHWLLNVQPARHISAERDGYDDA